MKILVTGGYGFVGTKVAHALRAREHTVRALVRDRGRAKALEAQYGDADYHRELILRHVAK